MLTEAEVRALLVCRVLAATESCSSHHINHVEGQIRALVAVLTGKPPGDFGGSIPAVMEAAGIPILEHPDGTVEWPRDWLEAHGFEVDDEDEVSHPRFSEGW